MPKPPTLGVFASDLLPLATRLFAALGDPVANWQLEEEIDDSGSERVELRTWRSGERAVWYRRTQDPPTGFDSPDSSCSAGISGLPRGGRLLLRSDHEGGFLRHVETKPAGQGWLLEAWRKVLKSSFDAEREWVSEPLVLEGWFKAAQRCANLAPPPFEWMRRKRWRITEHERARRRARHGQVRHAVEYDWPQGSNKLRVFGPVPPLDASGELYLFIPCNVVKSARRAPFEAWLFEWTTGARLPTEPEARATSPPLEWARFRRGPWIARVGRRKASEHYSGDYVSLYLQHDLGESPAVFASWSSKELGGPGQHLEELQLQVCGTEPDCARIVSALWERLEPLNWQRRLASFRPSH